MIREALGIHKTRCFRRDAGVTTLRLSPIGGTVAERLDQLGQALDLVDGVRSGHVSG